MIRTKNDIYFHKYNTHLKNDIYILENIYLKMSLTLKQLNGKLSLDIKSSYKCRYRDNLINSGKYDSTIILPIQFNVQDEYEIYMSLYHLFNNSQSYAIKIENVQIIKYILSFLLSDGYISEIHNHLDLSDMLNYDIDDYLSRVWDIILPPLSSYQKIDGSPKKSKKANKEELIDINDMMDKLVLLAQKEKFCFKKMVTKIKNNELLNPFMKIIKQLSLYFKPLLQKYSDNTIREDFNWNNIYCSGGVIPTLLRINKKLEGSDIDLWVNSKEGLIRTLKYLYVPNKTLFILKKHAITVVIGKVNIQLMCMSNSNSIEKIVHGFDLTFVKSYYDGTNLYLSQECLVSWATKTLYKNQHFLYHHDSHARIHKSLLKGYRFDQDSYAFYNPNVKQEDLLIYLEKSPFVQKYKNKFYHLTKLVGDLTNKDLLNISDRFLTTPDKIHKGLKELISIKDKDLTYFYDVIESKVKAPLYDGVEGKENYGKNIPLLAFKSYEQLNTTKSKSYKFVTSFEMTGYIYYNTVLFNKPGKTIHVVLDNKENVKLVEHLKMLNIYNKVITFDFKNKYRNAIILTVSDSLVSKLSLVNPSNILKYTFFVKLNFIEDKHPHNLRLINFY